MAFFADKGDGDDKKQSQFRLAPRPALGVEKTKPILVKNKRKKAKMSVNLEFIRVNS